MIITRLFKHKMHVTRPPRMSSQLPQHNTYRPVVRNAVRHRDDGLEPKHTILITPHDASAVGVVAAVALVLHVVRALAVRLPDVDFDILQRRSVGRFDGAEAEQRLAVGVGGDGGSGGFGLRVVRVVGAEDGAFGGGGGLGVVY